MRELYLLPGRYHLPCRFIYRKLTSKLDASMFYVQNILTSKKRAIDIGANVGIYSYFFAKSFDFVEAFEPQLTCAREILDWASLKSNVRVHCTALSDQNGILPLHIPFDDGRLHSELATLNCNISVKQSQRIYVPANRLDEYHFQDVSLIKIDVEGYEDKVLSGAEKTIRKYKPVLLIEIEQRHIGNKPILSVFQQILELGYSGYFFLDDERFPLSEFSYEIHQKPFLIKPELFDLAPNYQQGYVNNFIFEPI